MNDFVLSTAAESSSTLRVVTEPSVVLRLMNGWEMRYLGPFLGREVTLSQAADELGVSLPRLHYQVRKLLAADLLCVSRTERRGGRALKLYRAVADRLFVPFELMTDETVEASLAKADYPWLPLFLRSLGRVWRDHPSAWGMRFERADSGFVRASVVPDPRREDLLDEPDLPGVFVGGWVTDLHLDFDEARALRRELAEVVARYAGRRGSARHLLQIRFGPLLDEPRGLPNVTVR